MLCHVNLLDWIYLNVLSNVMVGGEGCVEGDRMPGCEDRPH